MAVHRSRGRPRLLAAWPRSGRRHRRAAGQAGLRPGPGRLGYLLEGQLFIKEVPPAGAAPATRPGRCRPGLYRSGILRTGERRPVGAVGRGVFRRPPGDVGGAGMPRPRDGVRNRVRDGHFLGKGTMSVRPRDRHFDDRHQSDPGRPGGPWPASRRATYDYETPQPLWTEQEPRLWWDATVTAVRQVLSAVAIAGERGRGGRSHRPDARLGAPRRGR